MLSLTQRRALLSVQSDKGKVSGSVEVSLELAPLGDNKDLTADNEVVVQDNVQAMEDKASEMIDKGRDLGLRAEDR